MSGTIVSRPTTGATKAITQLALRLTSGDKDPIRGMTVPDGRQMFSVYDAMWNTGAYVSRDAVTSAWSGLMKSEYENEVRGLIAKELFAAKNGYPGP